MPLYIMLDIDGSGKIVLYASDRSMISIVDRPKVIANTVSQALREFAAQTLKEGA